MTLNLHFCASYLYSFLIKEMSTIDFIYMYYDNEYVMCVMGVSSLFAKLSESCAGCSFICPDRIKNGIDLVI